MLQNILLGPRCLLKGFQQLPKRKIKRYVILPCVMNLLIFSLAMFFGVRMIHHIATLFPHYLRWITPVLDILFFLISSAVLAYCFSMITNFLGAPFNSLLSAKTEQMVIGSRPFADDALKNIIKDLPRFFRREQDKIVYYLPRALLLLVLFFIPVINVIAGMIWFIFNAWMMSIQYLDYPMDNHKLTFKETKQFLSRHRLTCLMFGLNVLVVSMIPGINLIIMPASVIGATYLYLAISRDET